MRVEDFDYDLPRELIAQTPVTPRDHSRLLVLDRKGKPLEHRRFFEIGDYLRPGDCLVLNDTRVWSARLRGKRELTGGKWEGLLVGQAGDAWEMMTKSRGRTEPGERILCDREDAALTLIEKTPAGTWLVQPPGPGSVSEWLARLGHVPLPHYIRDGVDEPVDLERYQTVYASQEGSVAAPTAGLHFTSELLDRLAGQGIERVDVTLHVGRGTFQPVKVNEVEKHEMHAEWCEVSASAAATINAVKKAGGRVVAVGTTTARTLETASLEGETRAFVGTSNLFIRPPFRFRAFDALITNFHLPRSTLLMLVAALAGRERIIEAYKAAVRERYRFYSYGDAMFIG